MIYRCENCRFLFQRVSEPECCPNCGSANVREAGEAEQMTFQEKNREVRSRV